MREANLGLDNTPPDSEDGSIEGDRIGLANGGHSRAASVRTMISAHSTATTNGKPRNYFTHSGRVTAEPGQEIPTQLTATTATANAVQPKSAAPSISNVSTTSSKKSRFSFGFGRKAAAAA